MLSPPLPIADVLRGKRGHDDTSGTGARATSRSSLCQQELRDPLTVAISFMANPGQFRGCCTFTLECWDHSRYLEVALACSVALEGATGRSYPLTLRQLDQFPASEKFRQDCVMTFANSNQTVQSFLRRARNTCLVNGLVLQHHELRSVGRAWLYGCTSLESVTFERLPKLQSVGGDWLTKCTSLKSVTVADLPELTTVGYWWLSGCTFLESVTFERLPKLRSVADGWLQDCKSLTSVTFVDLELIEVGEQWLYGCTSIESATFERLPKLESVGSSWLKGCTSLKAVTFVDLPELAEVGHFWLQRCTSLESVTFERLPKLRSVGGDWLRQCTSLKSVTFADLPELTKAGDRTGSGSDWLYDCTSLERATFERIPKLATRSADLCLPPQCKVIWNLAAPARGDDQEGTE